MTTPDPHPDLNPTPASTGYQEQGQASGPQVGAPAGTRTYSDPATGDAATDTRATQRSGRDEPDKGAHEPLVSPQRSAAYSARWDQVKGGFVDEPRQAVATADELVSELLDELQELFRNQRRDIEQRLDADETSTEDLRVALRRYRSFFDRLLSL